MVPEACSTKARFRHMAGGGEYVSKRIFPVKQHFQGVFSSYIPYERPSGCRARFCKYMVSVSTFLVSTFHSAIMKLRPYVFNFDFLLRSYPTLSSVLEPAQ